MLSSRLVLSSSVLAVFTFFVWVPAQGSIIFSANHADDSLSPGADLDDVRLEVDLSVTGGVATMTFTNASVPPETSAVFKTIVLDLLDDDTDTAILWDPIVRNDISDGTYDWDDYNALPGFNPVITDGDSMIELSAANPAPHEGISPGGSLVVEFSTFLSDGSDVFDYLSAFDGGQDTAAYSLGFHAISTYTIENNGSLSGAYIPEPSVLAMLMIGGIVLAKRRRSM